MLLEKVVRSAVAAGETVIVHPDSSIEDGNAVNVVG